MIRSILNIDPNTEFQQMAQALDRLFCTPSRANDGPQSNVLPVDLYEQDGKLMVRAAVPGINPQDLEVQVENNVLTISGETKSDLESNEAKIYRREVSYGRFTRSVRLPEGLDLEKVDAQFANGVVTISLPRLEEQKPQALKVPIRTVDSESTSNN
jgi:HSP20 family protein